MIKSEIRRLYKYQRSQLSENDKLKMSESIVRNVINNFNIKERIVNVFLPIDRLNEINTFILINELRANKNTVCTPVSDFKTHKLKHIVFDNNTILEKNEWGIPEPTNGEEISSKNIDIVFVPLLASNQNGFRVGYGKGFYDRFLAECSENAKFIGLNYFEPIDSIFDINSDDIPLHYLVTPSKVISFGK